MMHTPRLHKESMAAEIEAQKGCKIEEEDELDDDFKEENIEETPGVLQAPWESKKHWLCRRKFIEDHREKLGIKVAVSLSMVWANINFMGCQYSTKVQEKVMYYPVPEDNEIERWLKVHPNIDRSIPQTEKQATVLGKRTSSLRPLLSKEENKKSLRKEDASEMIPFEDLTYQLDSFITMIRDNNQSDSPTKPGNSNHCNNNHIHTPSYNAIIQQLSKTCSCNLCFRNTQMVSRLVFLIQKAGMASFSFDYDKFSQSLDVYINGEFIGNWKGSTMKELKFKAASEIISEIILFQKHKPPICPSSAQVVVSKTELEMSNIPAPISAENKGHQLLSKIGWKEGERISPLMTMGSCGKAGFESKTSSLSSETIHQTLTKFINNEDMTQLKFSIDLSPQDRKLIHTLSGKYNLSHKSYSKGDERYLVVTKKF